MYLKSNIGQKALKLPPLSFKSSDLTSMPLLILISAVIHPHTYYNAMCIKYFGTPPYIPKKSRCKWGKFSFIAVHNQLFKIAHFNC